MRWKGSCIRRTVIDKRAHEEVSSPTLVNSLGIQSKAVNLLVIVQREPQGGLAVMEDSGNVSIFQWEL